MIVYFIENDKICTFKLPIEVAGNYILSDYDNNGNKRSLVSVEARDNTWYIRENSEVRILYNSNYTAELELRLFDFCQLVIYGTEAITMYIGPVYDNTFVGKKLSDKTSLLIGSSACDINYCLPIISDKQLQLDYINNRYIFKNLNKKIPIFVNKSRKDYGELNSFDEIFILGVKILIIGPNIFINNPNSTVVLMSNKLLPIEKSLIYNDYIANSNFYRDFYEERDYFFKTPLFQNAFEKLNLKIAPPPFKEDTHRDPLILTIVPSFIMSASSILMGYFAVLNIHKKGESFEDNLMTIVMCVGMLVASILWPFVERFYERLVDFRTEHRRTKKYTKYLIQKENILEKTVKEQKTILRDKHLSLSQCQEAIFNKNPILFSRNFDNNDFLSIRLGVGSVPMYCEIEYDKEEYNQIDDKLLGKVDTLINKYKYLDETPFALSLYDKNIVSFIGSNHLKTPYMNAILLQLLTYHSYIDLKIVIFSDIAVSSSLNYLKESNYCWNNEKDFRFFANCFDDAQIVSEYLEKEFNLRTKDLKDKDDSIKDEKNTPYYLIISDNISIYKNVKIIKDVLELKKHVGFGLVMFDAKVGNIPDGCKNFVNYNESEGNYFMSEMSSDHVIKFKPEFLNSIVDVDIDKCISFISNIPIKLDTNDSGVLPDSLGFLEMNGVGKIEQLNSIKKWTTSNIVNSLATPIGVDANGNLLNLDLHEKKHGPHGLIAGMTGSGKSEFIITYILSLAVNYSPNEVQFVLIDYKGGGLAGAFENRKTSVKLPHLVGTITNLDKAEMKRTLVSIKSELQRRQRIFNEVKEKINTGTIDIYKYQKLVRDGTIQEPLSHLFIICDEFAELKAQQPEFMDELVSAARIGRSLGVHLILATQKPSGVVDEQIWSNSKFKVCCKVQTTDDSNEMIRKPDAAFIKETGRFYLQVGYDEYFVKGQAAYTGASYIPSEKIRTKVSDGIDFINNIGEIIKSATKKEESQTIQENFGEELTNTLKYLIDTAKMIGFENKQLWLDNIPSITYLENTRKKYDVKATPYQLAPLVGEYDDPQNQLQGPVLLPISGNNIFIAGVSGSGKSTLLSTIIYSTIISHSTAEVQLYIIDLLAESLKKFESAPQVGEVLTVGDKDKIEKLFYYLQRIAEKRKKYYTINGGSFESDIKKGQSAFANIVVIINGFDVFKEQFETYYEELFAPFSRDCIRNGITFIVTGTTVSSLGFMAENNFSVNIAMRLLDSSDYGMLFSNTKIIPSTNPGRGLIALDNVYEFQTALIFDESSYDTNLAYMIEQLNKIINKKANKIPTLPNTVTISAFRNEQISLSSIPVGIELKSACPYFYNFDRLISLITYKKEQSIKNFLPALIHLFSFLDVKNIFLSAYDYMTIENDKVVYYNSSFKTVLAALYKNLSKVINDSTNTNKYIITIFGYSKLMKHMNTLKEETSEEETSQNEIITVDDLILLAKDSSTVRFILVDSCELLNSIDDFNWYNLATTNNGILVAEELDNQELFVATDDYSNNSLGRDEAIVITNGTKNYIKFVNKG